MMYFMMLPKVRRPSRTPAWRTPRSLLHKDHVRRRFRHVHGAVHGNADIGRMERRGIVDAVAEIPHHMAAPFQGEDDPVFLGRRHAAEEVHLLHPRRECRIIHLLDLCAGEHPGYGKAELRADMLGHQFVVAGDDLDRDPVGGKSGQSRLGALLGRIEEGGKARKDQFRFIAHHGMGVVHPHLP